MRSIYPLIFIAFMGCSQKAKAETDAPNTVTVLESLEAYEKLLETSEKPVFVMLSKNPCKYCVLILPRIEKLAELYSEVSFVKLTVNEIENGRSLLRNHGLTYVPSTLVYYKNAVEAVADGTQQDPYYLNVLNDVMTKYRADKK